MPAVHIENATFAVTGGCGFIGSHVAEQLLARGHEVAIFARPNVDRRNVEAIQSRLRLIGGDFQNAENVHEAVAGMDAVIHLIGSTVPGWSFHRRTFGGRTRSQCYACCPLVASRLAVRRQCKM